MPLRRVAGDYDWQPSDTLTGRAYQKQAPQEDIDELLGWLDDNGLLGMSTYWAIYEDVPDEPLPPRAVKGAPGPDVVRTGSPETLRRWQSNAHMRQVATAWRPDLDPDEAVAAWYRQGGTMQPLRWSDEEVDTFAGSLEAEAREKGEPRRGQYVLFVDSGRGGSRRRRRERGEVGSERRALYNARRREQRARRRRT